MPAHSAEMYAVVLLFAGSKLSLLDIEQVIWAMHYYVANRPTEDVNLYTNCFLFLSQFLWLA